MGEAIAAVETVERRYKCSLTQQEIFNVIISTLRKCIENCELKHSVFAVFENELASYILKRRTELYMACREEIEMK